jgi:hypothetical protein
MTETSLSPPPNPVDPAATWSRLVTRQRRTLRAFCGARDDAVRLEARAAWLEAHRQLMDSPAADQAELFHKIHSMLLLADMGLDQAAKDLSAIIADLQRLAELDRADLQAAIALILEEANTKETVDG